MSTVLRRLESELSMQIHEAKQKIGASAFAHQLYEEIMKDAPLYIGFESGGICWGNDLNRRPEKGIHFSDRGYYGLSGLELDALVEVFVRKSDNLYSKYYDEDYYFWPYRMVRIFKYSTRSLNTW